MIKKANREAVFSRLFGNNISRMREVVAHGLIQLHIGPNALTVLGLLFTLGGGFFLGPTHNFQVDIPTANIVAMYEAAKEWSPA